MQGHSKLYSQDTGEGHIFVPAWAYNSVTQGTFTFLASSTSLFYFLLSNDTADAINDRINYKLYLSPGTYTFRCYHRKNTNGGIVTLALDSTAAPYVEYGTADFNAAASVNNLWTIADIPISEGELFNVMLLTKGTTSGTYAFWFSHFTFFRTA